DDDEALAMGFTGGQEAEHCFPILLGTPAGSAALLFSPVAHGVAAGPEVGERVVVVEADLGRRVGGGGEDRAPHLRVRRAAVPVGPDARQTGRGSVDDAPELGVITEDDGVVAAREHVEPELARPTRAV